MPVIGAFDTALFLQLVWSGLAAGALYSVMAFGFALIYFTTRILHFAHGAMVILLSYVIYALVVDAGLSWPVAGLLAVPIGFLLGLAMEMGVYRPVRRRSERDELAGSALFISSLGIGLVVINVIPIIFSAIPRYLPEGIIADAVLVYHDQVAITHISLVTVPGSILLIGAMLLWLKVSNLGRTIRAVIDNPQTSEIIGLRVARTNLLVLGIGSALAAPVAVILILSRGADSQADNLMVIAITVSLVGGIGSLGGVLAGGFLVGLIANVSLYWLPTAFGEAIIYAALLLFITFRPQGLFGRAMAKRA
jgi:branched-subunit amino acid ABC-type transport system permease component